MCTLGCRQQLLAHNGQWLRRALERAAKIIWLFAQAVICTGRWIEAYLGPPKVLWRGVWCPSPIGFGYCILVRSASGVRTLIGGCSWKTHFILIKWCTKHSMGDASETPCAYHLKTFSVSVKLKIEHFSLFRRDFITQETWGWSVSHTINGHGRQHWRSKRKVLHCPVFL